MGGSNSIGSGSSPVQFGIGREALEKASKTLANPADRKTAELSVGKLDAFSKFITGPAANVAQNMSGALEAISNPDMYADFTKFAKMPDYQTLSDTARATRFSSIAINEPGKPPQHLLLRNDAFGRANSQGALLVSVDGKSFAPLMQDKDGKIILPPSPEKPKITLHAGLPVAQTPEVATSSRSLSPSKHQDAPPLATLFGLKPGSKTDTAMREFMQDCVSSTPMSGLLKGERHFTPAGGPKTNGFLIYNKETKGFVPFVKENGKYLAKDGTQTTLSLYSRQYHGDSLRMFSIPETKKVSFQRPGESDARQSPAANASQKPQVAGVEDNQKRLQQDSLEFVRLIRGPTQPFTPAKDGDKETQIKVTKNHDGNFVAKAANSENRVQGPARTVQHATAADSDGLLRGAAEIFCALIGLS